jgi:hypothetical protein
VARAGDLSAAEGTTRAVSGSDADLTEADKLPPAEPAGNPSATAPATRPGYAPVDGGTPVDDNLTALARASRSLLQELQRLADELNATAELVAQDVPPLAHVLDDEAG